MGWDTIAQDEAFGRGLGVGFGVPYGQIQQELGSVAAS